MKNFYLSRKQCKQVTRMANEFQSYLPFEESTFGAFINDLHSFIRAMVEQKVPSIRQAIIRMYRTNLHNMIDKYYPDGYKANKMVRYNYRCFAVTRLINPEYGFTPLEQVVAMKMIRAFRDFARSEFKNEEEYINRLDKAAAILR